MNSYTRRVARRATGVVALVAFLSGPSVAVAQEAPRLALEPLVREAIERHPEVLRAREAAAAAREIPSRVGSLPDPVFGVQAQNIRIDEPALDSSPMSAIQLGVTEAMPFPGKLSRRSEAARARAATLEREVEASRTRIALGVRRGFWRLHFAERALEITAGSEKILGALADAVVARVAVGRAAAQDALQAQVAQSRVRSLLLERREGLVSMRRALAASVGRRPSADLPLTDSSPPGKAALDRTALLEQAVTENPFIDVGRGRVEAAVRLVDEAEYDRWPDLQLGAGWRLRAIVPGDPSAGADMFGATVGITLPVFIGAKQNARVREARRDAEAARAALADVELEVATRLERAIDAIERLDGQIALYERELLPEAERALDASIADYSVGAVGFVTVLMNWEAHLDAGLTRERLLADRAERLAEVRSLTQREDPR